MYSIFAVFDIETHMMVEVPSCYGTGSKPVVSLNFKGAYDKYLKLRKENPTKVIRIQLIKVSRRRFYELFGFYPRATN